jgi:hypothetical protein
MGGHGWGADYSSLKKRIISAATTENAWRGQIFY